VKPRFVIGIDVGTSSVKAGVYALGEERSAVASVPARVERASDGGVTQDLDQLYRAAADATRAALAQGRVGQSQVEAVAFSGQMAGVGLVDSRHRPLAAYDSWLDGRCAAVLETISPELSRLIALRSGCAPTLSIGPKMAWWERTRPEITAAAAKFTTAAGYVAGRAAGLRGEDAFIDPTYLHFASVADNAAARWDPELAEALGVPERLLPRIVNCADVIGRLTGQAGQDFGLAPGTPVAAGCGDTAAAALGADINGRLQAFDVAGTAAALGVRSETFAPARDGGLLTMREPLGPGYYSLAYVGGAGEIVEWLCRTVLGRRDLGDAAYAELDAAGAAAPPGADGLVASPHFSGRVCPPAPALRGAFLGLRPVHGRAHLVRAVLEAIAYEYRGYAETALGLVGAGPGDRLSEVVGIGGGACSATWNQIKADVLGTSYSAVTGVEVGARGAAAVAAAAIGAHGGAVAAPRRGPRFDPDPALAGIYGAHYRHYRAWIERLAEDHLRVQPADPAGPAPANSDETREDDH
jgi:xylulokinase